MIALAIGPALVLATVLVAVALHNVILPLVVLVAAYYLTLAVAAVTRLSRRTPSSNRQAVAPVTEQHSGLLSGDVPSWLKTDRNSAAHRERMLDRYGSFGEQALRRSALLSKSIQSREILARLATSGRVSYAQLIEAVHMTNLSATELVGSTLLGTPRLSALVTLAKTVHGQNVTPTDRDDAIALLECAVRVFGLERLTNEERMRYAGYLVHADRFADAAKIIASFRQPGIRLAQLVADALNPFSPQRLGATEVQWIAAFSRIFTEFGLEPVALAPARAAAAALPFDRLLAERPADPLGAPTDDRPLISVIMAAFRPGPELLASVRSVINQSWSNWELLLVDDCSGPEYRSTFEQCRALDPRIRLLANDQNVGTYRTRNNTLDVANGEFVTIQDADDWMHPRRLELQVRHLIENSTEIANISYSLRVSEHLLFAQDRGYDLKLCEPAILFRRAEAIAAVGYFDSVRAGADTEYRSRLGVAQGHPVVTLSMLPPLTLQRFSLGSLSGSDISTGWLHPARVAYRSAWAQWHASTMSDGQVPFLPKAQDERRFPAPARLSGVRLPAPQKYDLLFALDFVGRADSRNELASVRAELEAFVSAGKRMAVLHLWAFGAAPAPDFRQAEAIQQLINDGTIDQVFIDDEIIVDRLVVRTPEVLQFPPPWPSTIRPASTRIMRPRDPALIVERDCEINAEALFGRTATWISSGELRRIVIEKS